MSKLESIVPPLELCKMIPEGELEDAVFAWHYTEEKGILCRTSGCETFSRKTWQVVRNHPCKIKIHRRLGEEIFPAPTLEEILDALVDTGVSFCRKGMAIRNEFHDYPVSAEEAIRLWLRMKEINCD